jgi:hypothetical protein
MIWSGNDLKLTTWTNNWRSNVRVSSELKTNYANRHDRSWANGRKHGAPATTDMRSVRPFTYAVKDLVKEKAIGACVYRKPYPGLLSEKSAKLAR